MTAYPSVVRPDCLTEFAREVKDIASVARTTYDSGPGPVFTGILAPQLDFDVTQQVIAKQRECLSHLSPYELYLHVDTIGLGHFPETRHSELLRKYQGPDAAP